ncbi:MAG: L,D-transpeptidase, partial [Luteimonas sp.]
GAAPALLGLALGDDPNASIRNRKLADIGPELRVTPAGRFLASLGHDPAGKEILWIDYDNSIALHAVATNRPEERRLQRLASPLPQERRISWGCINVPKHFYATVVSPAFKGTQGVVYVLPETRPASEVFELN